MTPVDSSILPITSNGDTPDTTHAQLAPVASTTNTLPNSEWQLADFVDAIAAEVDRAEDTLSLKSYARGISFAIKQLSLDLEVSVRRDPDGRILFRTRDDEQAGGTVLKLDFAQMLQSQLEGVRKQLHRPADPRELSTLSGITDEQIRQLNAIAIYSVDDLERYTQTAAMIAEVSRKTGISDPQIRKWRKLPFLHAIKPESGPPGATVLIEGGNFGLEPDPNAVVLFAGQPATIDAWSDSRLTITMPRITGSGFVFGVIDGQVTNSVSWEAQSIDLVVDNITITPAEPLEGEPIFVAAELLNRGGTATQPFEVEWTIDNQPQERQRHGVLLPGQQSQELSVRRRVSLPPGMHTIRFTADPDATLPDSNPANSSFSRRITVKPRHQLVIGDFRRIETLDPILTQSLGPGDVLNLVFRGLTRLDPETGRSVPDIAKSISVARPQGPGVIHLELRDDVTFHDGTPLTVADVAFTYANARQGNSPWHKLVQPITVNVDEQKRTVTLLMQHVSQALLSPLLRIGIVPRHVYEPDSRGFAAKPVGSGPFRIEQAVPGERITLRPWEKFVGGTPRLDQIDIALTADVERLFKLVMSHQVVAATLPYIEGFEAELARRGEWLVVAIKDAQQPLLHVQSKRVHERQPNQHDTNWNAHLWYVDPEPNDR